MNLKINLKTNLKIFFLLFILLLSLFSQDEAILNDDGSLQFGRETIYLEPELLENENYDELPSVKESGESLFGDNSFELEGEGKELEGELTDLDPDLFVEEDEVNEQNNLQEEVTEKAVDALPQIKLPEIPVENNSIEVSQEIYGLGNILKLDESKLMIQPRTKASKKKVKEVVIYLNGSPGKGSESVNTKEKSVGLKFAEVKTFINANKYEDALLLLDEIETKEPDNVRLHNIRGSIFYKLGFFSKAIKSWTRSLELNADQKIVEKYLNKIR